MLVEARKQQQRDFHVKLQSEIRALECSIPFKLRVNPLLADPGHYGAPADTTDGKNVKTELESVCHDLSVTQSQIQTTT